MTDILQDKEKTLNIKMKELYQEQQKEAELKEKKQVKSDSSREEHLEDTENVKIEESVEIELKEPSKRGRPKKK